MLDRGAPRRLGFTYCISELIESKQTVKIAQQTDILTAIDGIRRQQSGNKQSDRFSILKVR